MSPAAKGTGRTRRKSSASSKRSGGTAKRSTRRSSSQAGRSGSRRSEAKLREELDGLHRWEAVRGPHTTGLGYLQMWVTAYSIGVLELGKDSEEGLEGRIL